ncbi:hypothetical protein [Microbacterium sp. SS28]|uniref:hypothetical protein n=1 Tax=Microbacterium sp. SS28 TaxID=2919948 RepID=UPI001FA9CBD9|nr:hypothetical protein [Microbacterium sp. SS28]
MIAAGLLLLAIGAADLVREFAPARRRWIGFAAGALVLLVVAAFAAALPAALLALAVAAGWVVLTPVAGRPRAGFWPVVAVGAVSALSVGFFPPRPDAGLIGEIWNLDSPFGPLTFDHVVLLTGAAVFLLESANVVVRAALAQEHVQVVQVPAAVAVDEQGTDAAAPDDSAAAVDSAGVASSDPARGALESAGLAESGEHPEAVAVLKGGRLIGPLERLMVFALTLAGMYPLLAAVLAAKGIVRFPEISRDSAAGNRAEYFLIGSLVSWVLALAAAFLVWWAFATP